MESVVVARMMFCDHGLETRRFDCETHALEVTCAVERLELAIPPKVRRSGQAATRQAKIRHWSSLLQVSINSEEVHRAQDRVRAGRDVVVFSMCPIIPIIEEEMLFAPNRAARPRGSQKPPQEVAL